jgi:hypothetical protein
MMNSKGKKIDLSKYKLYLKDLNPNNPFHARILENFKVFKNCNKIKQAKKERKDKNKD